LFLSSYSMTPPPPISTLFPYTTLFRSLVFRALDQLVDLHDAVGIDDIDAASRVDRAAAPLRSAGCRRIGERALKARRGEHSVIRSEEHTSELQSRENLVCRLLLEKKKK